MFKNFWWPLEFSHVVGNKPARLHALGQDFVIYRKADGAPQVMSDLCIHRGGALSGGWTKGDCIVCPYHGWEYKPDGECARIPANLPGVAVPKRARVDAYPTQEKYGFVWAFLGDIPENERPPMPVFPEFDDANYKIITGEFKWDANYERVCENALDAAHAAFVHGGVFGNPDEPEIEDFEVEQDDYSIGATLYLKSTPSKGLWGRVFGGQKEPAPTKTRPGFMMPCITTLAVDMPLGKMRLFDVNLPIDENTTLTKWVSFRTFFKGRWADGDARKRIQRIFDQDHVIVSGQRPELVPFDLNAELHVRSDAMQVAYRKMRKRFIDRGWGIDAHRIEIDANRKFTVIPSPARRANPELAHAWVMKEAPIVQNTSGDLAS